MAKIVGKGSVLKQDVSSVLTAVANVMSVNHQGAATEVFESRDLGTGVGITKSPTGYTEGGTVEWEMFLDPGLVGHQAITDDLATPPAAGRDYSITFSDTSVWFFTAAGITFGTNIVMNDGVKSSVSADVTGLVGYL